MAAKVLNIEIGDRIVKVCLSIPKGKTYQIRNSFMFQTPYNTVTDGQISDPAALAEALKAKLSENSLSDVKNVIFALTSGKVASREVTIPPVKDSRIKSVVETNASDYFPVDMSAYHVTYSLLERVDKGEKAGCRLLVLAAPMTLLEGYFNLAAKAGLNITAIDYAGNSQYQAIRSIADSEVTMYVNVDCSSSFVTFTQGKNLVLQRAFSFGGDELIVSYMDAAESTDYLETLKTCCLPDQEFLAKNVLTASNVNDSLNRLATSIARTVDYFNSSHWDTPVTRVVLMGPCARLVGLRDMVNQDTTLTTEYLDELPAITELANVAQSASAFISCIGSSIAPLDFLPERLKVKRKLALTKPKEKTDSLTGSIIICLVCLLAAGGMAFFALTDYASALREKEALSKKIESLRYVTGVYDTYVTYQESAAALETFAAGTVTPNDDLQAFLTELEQKMPTEITVLSALCSTTNVSMNVTVPGLPEVANVLVQLRTFESIRDIQLSGVAEAIDEAGFTYVSFSVNAAYGINPYLPATN